MANTKNDIETMILWWTNNGSFNYNHYMKVVRAKRKKLNAQ